MNSLFTKRLLAFLLDYAILLGYIAVLTGMTFLAFLFLSREPSIPNPVAAQAVGFVTLTVPVFLYFYLSERGQHHGTIGKRALGIQVADASANQSGNILLRNILKFLPWEIAHTGVHWMYFYTQEDAEPTGWLWVVLIVPQVVALVYLISILTSRGHRGLYDQIAHTRVITK